MSVLGFIKELFFDVVDCVVGAARNVADKVCALAPLFVKVAKVALCSFADAAVSLTPGTTLMAVNGCIALIKALPAAIEADEDRVQTKPEPVAQDHACETTWEDLLDELSVGVLSGLVTMVLVKGAKAVKSSANRARAALCQPVWTVTRNTPLTPWMPTSVRAAT